jgi:hypothetical protein
LVLDPVYIWDNTGGTRYNSPGITDWESDDCGNGLVSESFIKEGRDYYVNTPKPGYAPYTYPHPLRLGNQPARLVPRQTRPSYSGSRLRPSQEKASHKSQPE